MVFSGSVFEIYIVLTSFPCRRVDKFDPQTSTGHLKAGLESD